MKNVRVGGIAMFSMRLSPLCYKSHIAYWRCRCRWVDFACFFIVVVVVSSRFPLPAITSNRFAAKKYATTIHYIRNLVCNMNTETHSQFVQQFTDNTLIRPCNQMKCLSASHSNSKQTAHVLDHWNVEGEYIGLPNRHEITSAHAEWLAILACPVNLHGIYFLIF